MSKIHTNLNNKWMLESGIITHQLVIGYHKIYLLISHSQKRLIVRKGYIYEFKILTFIVYRPTLEVVVS